jgi:hypothetical protein
LQTVSFADNQISKIGNNTFVNCGKLAQIDLRNNACFDVAFGEVDRDQHEFCSGVCEKSCFIVNVYEKKDLTMTTSSPDADVGQLSPGIVRGQPLCKKGLVMIDNICRNVRV